MTLTALVMFACSGVGAAADARTPPARSATLLAGYGNATGWLGIQGERYLGTGRYSVFAGLGYAPSVEERQATGVAVAAGVRAYTLGVRHRAFVDLLVSQLAAEVTPEGSLERGKKRSYGPAVQVGYQYVAQGGFTVVVSTGVGYAVNAIEGDRRVRSTVGVAMGYAWRR